MNKDLKTTQELVDEHGAIDLELVGLDGNAFSIMGAVSRAAKKAGWPADARSELQAEMMSGDYDHLLQVAMVAVGNLNFSEES